MILVGDIGGAKVSLALFVHQNGRLSLERQRKYASQDYPGLEAVLRDFFSGGLPALDSACFGVAGPVENGYCQATNLEWTVAADELKKFLGIDAVWLINDLAAMACATPFLRTSEVEVIQAGTATGVTGRVAVIAAGTGLGQALLIPENAGRYRVLDSEGGHCDFPFLGEREAGLYQFLRRLYGRVSIERVLSGKGLAQIYLFLKEYYSLDEPGWLTDEFRENDAAAVVARNGMEEKSELCQKALTMFVSFYGRVAGDLALQYMAKGGVYIGGGIAPKIISMIKSGPFMEAFLAKGRWQKFMATIPVKVIMDERASLIGAAQFALGEKFAR